MVIDRAKPRADDGTARIARTEGAIADELGDVESLPLGVDTFYF
jgi:hypothetical protein